MTNPPPPSRPLRVLLIAEAANPQWVSVPLVGWSQYKAISQLTQAHLVTQIRNHQAILDAGLVEGRDFTAIDSESLAGPMWKLARLLRGGSGKGWTTGTALAAIAYPHFERLVWKKFGDAIRSGQYDLVHRITPLSPTIPSPIARRCAGAGVPFVLGPLNGGVPWPPGFDAQRREEKEWLSYVRGLYRCLPGYRATRRHAAAILVGSADTLGQMPSWVQPKCFYLPENGIDPQRFSQQRTRSACRPIRAVFVGRLVPYKGADMLLEAAGPLIKAGEMTLQILGDGPQMPRLRQMLTEQGFLPNQVDLPGFIPHEQLQSRLIDADLLTFPSIREFGGGVVLEAMAVGLPPVVVDYGGPGELVTSASGFLLPLGDRARIVQGMRDLLADLCRHPEKIDAKSPAALHRARTQFTWSAKAESTLQIYRWVLDKSLPRPRLPMPIPDENDE